MTSDASTEVDASDTAGAAGGNEGSSEADRTVTKTAVNARQDGSTVDIDLSERAYNVDFPEYKTSYDYKEWDKNDVTYLILAGESIEAKGKDAGTVKAEGGTVTITDKGTYVLSGNLDGKIVVDTGDEKCRLVLNGVNFCMNRGCRVWSVKDGYRLGDDIQSKVLAFAFGLSAEIERNLISQRTREALARKKAEGAALGRPAGKPAAANPLCERNAAWIREQLREGRAKSEIARDLGVARGTLYRFLAMREKNARNGRSSDKNRI